MDEDESFIEACVELSRRIEEELKQSKLVVVTRVLSGLLLQCANGPKRHAEHVRHLLEEMWKELNLMEERRKDG